MYETTTRNSPPTDQSVDYSCCRLCKKQGLPFLTKLGSQTNLAQTFCPRLASSGLDRKLDQPASGLKLVLWSGLKWRRSSGAFDSAWNSKRTRGASMRPRGGYKAILLQKLPDSKFSNSEPLEFQADTGGSLSGHGVDARRFFFRNCPTVSFPIQTLWNSKRTRGGLRPATG